MQTEAASLYADVLETQLTSLKAWDYVGSSFSLTSALAGQSVRVAVRYTDGFGTAESVVTAATAAVNRMVGTAGADTLAGSAGADRLEGLAGNDGYTVNHAGDVVMENAGEGIDTVNSSIDYTLTTNVENLVLTGSQALKGNGNSLANTLTGNSGSNVLTGGLGADTLVGGQGGKAKAPWCLRLTRTCACTLPMAISGSMSSLTRASWTSTTMFFTPSSKAGSRAAHRRGPQAFRC